MWIFTTKLFLSIVVDKDNSNHRLFVRDAKGSSKKLYPDAEVFQELNANYVTESLFLQQLQYASVNTFWRWVIRI